MANSKRKCTGCNRYLRQDKHDWRRLPVGWFHTNQCAIDYGKKSVVKKKANAEKKKKQDWADKKVSIKGMTHQNKLTQIDVNKYVRLRDKYNKRACISCGSPIDYVTRVRGGTHDAGHYKTVKAHTELRFNTANINAECKFCNNHDDEHLIGMRLNIVDRYGQARLDWLDGPHKIPHRTVDWHIRYRRILKKRMKRYR